MPLSRMFLGLFVAVSNIILACFGVSYLATRLGIYGYAVTGAVLTYLILRTGWTIYCFFTDASYGMQDKTVEIKLKVPKNTAGDNEQ